MGRYRSSPTCSKCYQTGHTKRGCPTYKAKAEEWLSTNKHLEGTDEYPFKPYWVREVENYKNIGKNRKCSWCDEYGHNKRSCSDRKSASAKNIEKNKEWRAQVLESLKNLGFGVGTLIERKRNYDTDSGDLYMVTDMYWDKINLKCSSNDLIPYTDFYKQHYKDGISYPSFRVKRVSNGRENTMYYPQVVDDNGTELLYHSSNKLNIVSSVEPRPPSDWVNDESWAKGLF